MGINTFWRVMLLKERFVRIATKEVMPDKTPGSVTHQLNVFEVFPRIPMRVLNNRNLIVIAFVGRTVMARGEPIGINEILFSCGLGATSRLPA